MLIYNEGTVIKQCVLRQDLGFLVSLEVQTTLGKDESKDCKKDESEDFKKDESKDFKRPDLMNMSGTSTGVTLASPACPADTVSTHAAMNYG